MDALYEQELFENTQTDRQTFWYIENWKQRIHPHIKLLKASFFYGQIKKTKSNSVMCTHTLSLSPPIDMMILHTINKQTNKQMNFNSIQMKWKDDQWEWKKIIMDIYYGPHLIPHIYTRIFIYVHLHRWLWIPSIHTNEWMNEWMASGFFVLFI